MYCNHLNSLFQNCNNNDVDYISVFQNKQLDRLIGQFVLLNTVLLINNSKIFIKYDSKIT